MDIEQSFAAAVLNAKREAKLATRQGFPQTEADQIEMAIAELWQYDPAGASLIADRHIERVAGVPRARPVGGNVTSLR